MKLFTFEKRCVLLIIVLFLTCCTSGGKKIEQEKTSPPRAVMKSFSKDSDELDNSNNKATAISHLTQCNRDLESLHRISPSDYVRYRNEYDSLMRSSSGFIAVSEDISDEVSDLARPRFQFALVNLCYRIKNALAQSLISQASGEENR